MVVLKTKKDILLKVRDNDLAGIISGRVYLKEKGWTKVKVDDGLKEVLCNEASDIWGGHLKTRIRIYNNLLAGRYHWALGRTSLEEHDGEIKLEYTTGQDSITEYQLIRTELSK